MIDAIYPSFASGGYLHRKAPFGVFSHSEVSPRFSNRTILVVLQLTHRRRPYRTFGNRGDAHCPYRRNMRRGHGHALILLNQSSKAGRARVAGSMRDFRPPVRHLD